MYIDSDPTPTYHIARAICHLQALYGIIPRIYGKGKNAKVLLRMYFLFMYIEACCNAWEGRYVWCMRPYEFKLDVHVQCHVIHDCLCHFTQTIADLMERMRVEMFGNSASAREIVPQIDAIILLDRSVDLLTPLSTQLTYEGLVDEVFGIKHCKSYPAAGTCHQYHMHVHVHVLRIT